MYLKELILPALLMMTPGVLVGSGNLSATSRHQTSHSDVTIHETASLPNDRIVIALQAVSPTKVFVAIESNPALGGNGSATIYRTSDGGQNWTRVTKVSVGKQQGLFWFRFFNLNDGYLLVNGRSLWRTTNGGKSWGKTRLPSVTAREDISFPTFAQGWILQQGAAASGIQSVHILHTSDGGREWSRIASTSHDSSSGLPLAGLKFGISFLNVDRGWMNGGWNTLGATWLYGSLDGGRRWSSIGIPLAPALKSSELQIHIPRISSSGFGLLPLGAGKTQTVWYVSNDAGRTWVPSIHTSSRMISWSVAGNSGWISTSDELIISHNRGISWRHNGIIHTHGTLRDLQFITPESGWAILSYNIISNTVVRSVDGGLKWSVMRLP